MITLTSTDHIHASPEQVWNFFTRLHEDDTYMRWHPVDHISWTLLNGDSEKVGSTYHFAEMIGGKKLASKFRLNKVERLKYLEYGVAGLLRPLNPVTATFTLIPQGKAKIDLIAKVQIGYTIPIIGNIVDWIARRCYDMTAVRQHMQEEGKYLNQALNSKMN